MSRENRVEWLEAYSVVEQGFKDRDVFAVVVPAPIAAQWTPPQSAIS
jgi:hypothetical protein